MDYNVAQLLRQPMGTVRRYELNEDMSGLDPDLQPTEALRGSLRLIRTKNGMLVQLDAQTRLRVICSHCLEPTVVPVSLHVQEEFLQTVDVVSGLPLAAAGDDPALLIDDHHELHLKDWIRQYLLLALPMSPLCRADCKGLCPRCGKNLNQGPCACPPEAPDERWSALKVLLEQ